MPAVPNYYEILGVHPADDAATIKRAYYDRMRRVHPDTFLAERRRLEIVGDKHALKQLDDEIELARRQAQAINAAYNILSDPERRARYDRYRADEINTAAAATVHPDAYYDSRQHRRPHHRPGQRVNTARPERFPAVLAIGFLLLLVLGTAFISNFLVAPGSSRQRSLPATINVPAGSMDATAQARRRTPTPRPAASYIISGDALYAAGLYQNAIDEYAHAIAAGIRTAEVFYKRGRAHAADKAFDLALADFNRALQLDATYLEAYRERGLVFFRLWQFSGKKSDAELARIDLTRYEQSGGDMTHPDLIAAQQALEN